MPLFQARNPYDQYFDTDGSPLDDGMIYIGSAGINPLTSPIPVFWDADGFIPAAQPIRTRNGFPYRSGSPARIYIDAADYSILVKNKAGALIYSALNATSLADSEKVGYVNGDGVSTNVQNGMVRQFSSVKSIFGKTGDNGGEQATLTGFHPGSKIGGGDLVWSPSTPKSQHDGFRIYSPTVPSDLVTTSQSTILNYLNGSGETDPFGNGCWVRFFDGPAWMEWGGVTAGTDCGLIAQKMVDDCVPSGISLNCSEVLTTGSQIKMPQYRDTPPVQRQFDHSSLSLRSVISTMTSGNAFWFESSGADLNIGELNGPGPDAGVTKGIYMSGQGGGRVKVNFIQGFQNGVELNQSYAHSLNVGWIDNCIRGIALINSNDNRITGGRVGGRFSTPLTVGIDDPTTCEIGVDIGIGCTSNRITMNIEYCRRSVTAIGLKDSGTATQFNGYIESCRAWNVYADGRNANIKVMPGGTVSREDNSGYFAGDTNSITFEMQQDYYNETPAPAVNTLEFMTLQAIATNGTGSIDGMNGLNTYARNVSSARNEVLNGSLLGSAQWAAVGFGGASVAGIFSVSSTALPEIGIQQSTRITLPPLAADNAEYVISQSGITMIPGPFSFGLFAFCETGEVDVYVRVVSADATVQQRYVTKLTSVTAGGFKRIGSRLQNMKSDTNATYQIRLRSKTGATLYICGAYTVNRVDTETPAVNTGATRRTILPGTEVPGKAFNNGQIVNGPIQKEYAIVSAADTFTINNTLVPTIILTGNAYNIALEAGLDGQELVIKRDALPGTVGVVPTGTTIDGSAGMVNMGQLDVMRLKYVPSTGWLKV